ncbi:hypothetical protein BLAHAN_04135 [Blautia hansenii DSM 20583]|uniref:Uncharacterized protein n=1 Tax=Blautia hansenii DSM 20583 TaxID=537007 RepID=C9L446_BLAHA|nr:hypothetical protein BLAHAN_04135 [Blautia hansenii DSM 20583]
MSSIGFPPFFLAHLIIHHFRKKTTGFIVSLTGDRVWVILL